MPNQRRGYSAKKGAFWIQLIWTHPEPRKKREHTPHMGVHAHINIPIPITHTPNSKKHSFPHKCFPCKQPPFPSHYPSDSQQDIFPTHSLTTPHKGAWGHKNDTNDSRASRGLFPMSCQCYNVFPHIHIHQATLNVCQTWKTLHIHLQVFYSSCNKSGNPFWIAYRSTSNRKGNVNCQLRRNSFSLLAAWKVLQ